MKRLSEETGSLPPCRCRICLILMSLQTPGTTYHLYWPHPCCFLTLRSAPLSSSLLPRPCFFAHIFILILFSPHLGLSAPFFFNFFFLCWSAFSHFNMKSYFSISLGVTSEWNSVYLARSHNFTWRVNRSWSCVNTWCLFFPQNTSNNIYFQPALPLPVLSLTRF